MPAIGFSSGWATLFWDSDGEDPIDTVIYEVKYVYQRLPEVFQTPKPKIHTNESYTNVRTCTVIPRRFTFSPELDREILGRKATDSD